MKCDSQPKRDAGVTATELQEDAVFVPNGTQVWKWVMFQNEDDLTRRPYSL